MFVRNLSNKINACLKNRDSKIRVKDEMVFISIFMKGKQDIVVAVVEWEVIRITKGYKVDDLGKDELVKVICNGLIKEVQDYEAKN